MSDPNTITIEPYSDKNVLVQGDFDTHAKAMKRFQARWNPRLKKGPGWLVPLEFESAVRAYFGIDSEEPQEQPRYKPAPSSSRKVAPPAAPKQAVKNYHEPVEEPVEEPAEEEPAEEDVAAPLPAMASSRKVPLPVPASSRKVPAATSSRKIPEEDDGDVKSLAKRMKELMSRVDRLEKR